MNQQSIRSCDNAMPTPVNMDIDNPGEEDGDVQHTPVEETTVKIQSPPKVKRANREIEPTPERKEGSDNEDGTNHVTPGKEEPKSARENKDPKRTKVQSLDAYFETLKKNKQENSQHNSVAQVMTKRTKGGKS